MLNHLRWFYRLATTFIKVHPPNMLALIALGLFSRISAMLALLLPLKILLLVGNNRIPKYFPAPLLEVPYDTLVISLCSATVILYSTHLALDKLIAKIEDKAEKLLVLQLIISDVDQRTKKLLRSNYQRISSNLTDLFFLIVVFLFILFVYPVLFIAIFAFFVVVLISAEAYILFSQKANSDNEINDDDDQKSGGLISLLVDIGYLLSFFFIVFDMLTHKGPGILMAFICFLLIRRSRGGIKSLVKNLTALYLQKNNLSSLLYNDISLENLTPVNTKNTLSNMQVDSIIAAALRNTFPNKTINIISTTWFDQHDKNILAYLVDINVEGKSSLFITKLFLKQQGRAEAEAELYRATLSQLSEGLINHGNDQAVEWLLMTFSLNHTSEILS